ncbi:MAG: hypothetical protein GKR97_02870 [Rhizobiaceae bacterium]|nr:hypothetical protein [Rhizobiaceae bacterium]
MLEVVSRKDFHAYIADPDYQAIKQLRLDSVDKMLVLEGQVRQPPKSEFIQSIPQFAVIAGDFPPFEPQPLMDIGVSDRGAIKDPVPASFSAVQSVAVMALSYDDNPLSFLDNLGPQSLAYVVLKVE